MGLLKRLFFATLSVGIKLFRYFVVYDRYGQKVFYTTDPGIGWNGKISNHLYNTNRFTWMAAGVDYQGNEIVRKGVVISIR